MTGQSLSSYEINDAITIGIILKTTNTVIYHAVSPSPCSDLTAGGQPATAADDVTATSSGHDLLHANEQGWK